MNKGGYSQGGERDVQIQLKSTSNFWALTIHEAAKTQLKPWLSQPVGKGDIDEIAEGFQFQDAKLW